MIFGGIATDDELCGSRDFGDFSVQSNSYVGAAAFGLEHVGDVGGGTVAEKLAERFFVIPDAVLFHQGDEIGRRVAGQSGFGEVGIGGEEILRLAMDVGEVAAASAGDEDFLADAVGVFEDSNAAATLGGFEGAEEAGCAAADYQDVELMRQ